MKDGFIEKNYIYIAAILIMLYSIIAVTSISNKSVTYDEIVYVSAGYKLLVTGDYSINTEHPPLSKILAGLPLLFMQPNLPAEYKNQWDFSQKFFFGVGNDADKMLFLARLPFIMIGIILGIYIFILVNEIYGKKAGLLSLFFYAFSPDIIAHSQLATTDILVAAFLFISVYYLYQYLKHSKSLYIVLFGISYGLALSSKFTSVYFIPVFFAIAFLHHLLKIKRPLLETLRKKSFVFPLLDNVKSIVLAFAIASLFLGLTYMFRINYYFEGMSFVLRGGSVGRFSYLIGHHYIGSNILFYPAGFLAKSPMPFLVLLAAAFFFRKKLKYSLEKDIFLLVPAAIFAVPTLFNQINLGVRHILVIYPFLFAYAGGIVNFDFKNKIIKYAFFLLLAWYAISSALVYPHYLSYFNELAGGPGNGYNYLIDSNLDWGQDGKLLADYIKENNLTNISISYFGKDNLTYRGIDYNGLGCIQRNGIIAISINNLVGITELQAACSKWILEFVPYKKIGNTIWLFNITRQFTGEEIEKQKTEYISAQQKYLGIVDEQKNEECKRLCTESCTKNNKKYLKSGLANGKCGCSCA